MKLKLLTAALVLAASGSAHAIIADGNSNNGELFLTVWDKKGEISYIRDLNITMNTFLGDIVPKGQQLNFAADANWNRFVGMAADKNSLLWMVAAIDSTGATATDFHRYITTASKIDLNNTLTNLDLKNLGTNGNQMLGDANVDLVAADSAIITDKSRPGYAGSALWGDNWGGVANFTATGLIGQAMQVYLVRQSSGLFAARNNSSVYEEIRYNPPYVMSLNLDGSLNVAPIPEPETYALMLAGLGLVGWMARRRKA